MINGLTSIADRILRRYRSLPESPSLPNINRSSQIGLNTPKTSEDAIIYY